MTDLSRLLDDVYGDSGTGGEPAPAPPAPAAAALPGLPEWAVDSVLDEAFADWVPGAAADTGEPTGPVGVVGRSALSELAAAPPAAPARTEREARAWSRDDDDILPGRRGRRSRTTAVAPAADVAADEPAAEGTRGRLRRRKG